MGIHTADAIVLRQYPYRETSVLVTCLTDRFGKIKGIVKGLRGPIPRYRSAMEPLTLNRIVFYDTRSSQLHLISQCDLLVPFAELPRDLDVMRTAASCAELVDAVVEPEEPQPEIFAVLHATLARMAVGGEWLPAIRIHFVLRLLKLAGFHPQLDECTGCGQQPHAKGFWSARQGGLVCERCLHEDPSAEPIDPTWFDELSKYTDTDAPHIGAEQAAMIQARLDEFLRWRIDRPLKAMRVA